MIHFNQNLTQADAQWVLSEVFSIFSYRIAHPTLSKIMEGHNKVFQEQVSVPSCGCEYRATHAVWTSRLSQYHSQIEAIAYPPVLTEPSEIITEAVVSTQTLPNEIRSITKKTRDRKSTRLNSSHAD
jgi:hypothetical protein